MGKNPTNLNFFPEWAFKLWQQTTIADLKHDLEWMGPLGFLWSDQ